MKKLFPLCVLLCLNASFPAYAQPSSTRPVFDRVKACIQQHNLTPCRDTLTASSLPLYKRFTGYGLTKCLPSDLRFVSEKRSGNSSLVRAITQARGQDRVMRLVFVLEKKTWKLDIPATLRVGLGEKWESKIALAEQMYLLLYGQMGDKVDCGAVQTLVK